MHETPILVLLPGMEGTGTLFGPFLNCLPNNIDARVVRYPARTRLNYEQLEELVRSQLPREPHVILAESFSGPIALRIGASKGAGSLRAPLC